MIIVADTGPLISFSVIDKLDLLEVIFERVVIPEAVWRELETFIVPFAIPKAQKYRAHIVPLKKPIKKPLSLGPGEEEAMRLFAEINGDRLLIEDCDARRLAESRGIPCIGTPGVLVLAKRKGLITALGPLFSILLVKNRYFSLPLLNSILLANGEPLLSG
jgi:predicted nucleic acid-binding protein